MPIATSFVRVLRRPVESAQFTSMAFTSVLHREKIAISMDGRGAWRDNVFVERLWRSVKYEEVYLRAYDSYQLSLTVTHAPIGAVRWT